MIPFDTKPEIAAMHARLQDSMSGEQRVLRALEMSHYVHELAKQYFRDQHPDWSEERVTREFLRSLFPPGKAPRGF
ncbi:MAG TPA: hypothetical protein VFP59_19500 [Candidatus Angelobacter sp.]|nr:hypothetical protein [Candidatus Angelobacter sp.]